MNMFEIRERLEQTERAILVGLEWSGADAAFDPEESLRELSALADTAGVKVVCEVLHKRHTPDPGTFIGGGKVNELRLLNEEVKADVFLFDDDLTPGQIRNLEKRLDTKVLDRTDLILDIFAQRAQTKEAKLQVELAQLEYALPRLTRHWSHLSRLGGGSGIGGGVGTRGPGETQLQIDRRLIRTRITALRTMLKEVIRHRELQRRGRETAYAVALVGYTNAGKSSLLNALTGERHVHTENRLFATLDPTTRRLELPEGREVVLTDTVGFINRLPHRLVAAFRATLEEVIEANLLLHVVDASYSYALEHVGVVDGVLKELGAGEIPRLIVLNKTDLLTDEETLVEFRRRFEEVYPVSAVTGEGLDDLKTVLAERSAAQERVYSFRLPHSAGNVLSYLYKHGRVESVEYETTGVAVRAQLHPKRLAPVTSYLDSSAM